MTDRDPGPVPVFPGPVGFLAPGPGVKWTKSGIQTGKLEIFLVRVLQGFPGQPGGFKPGNSSKPGFPGQPGVSGRPGNLSKPGYPGLYRDIPVYTGISRSN